MTSEAIQQVLAILSGIAVTGATPIVSATQAPSTHSVASNAPRMDEASGIDAFFHSTLGPVMTETKQEY